MIAPKEHAALILLLQNHPPIKCGACGNEIQSALGKLDQAHIPLDAAIYACNDRCGWIRTVKLFAEHAEIEPSKDGIEISLKGEF